MDAEESSVVDRGALLRSFPILWILERPPCLDPDDVEDEGVDDVDPEAEAKEVDDENGVDEDEEVGERDDDGFDPEGRPEEEKEDEEGCEETKEDEDEETEEDRGGPCPKD